LRLPEFVAAPGIDRAKLGGRHEPGAGLSGMRRRATVRARHEGVLRELLGHADVAHDAARGPAIMRADSMRQTRRWRDGYSLVVWFIMTTFDLLAQGSSAVPGTTASLAVRKKRCRNAI